MKLFQTFASALAGVFVLTLALGAHAQSSNVRQFATVVRIVGEARYSPDGGTTWHPLVVGKDLGAGDVIQTAMYSKVDLVLGDKISARVAPAPNKVGQAPDPNLRGLVSYKAVAQQNVLRVGSDSVMAIDKLSASNIGADTSTDTELDLRQGTIFGSVKKLSATSTYQIKTPNGIAAIRGTTFVVSANGAITVTDGSAVISVVINGQTITQTVNAGEQFDPTTGQVTQLSPGALNAAEQTAVETFTVVEPVTKTITLASDTTTVYVSPTTGYSGGSSPPPPQD